MNILLNFENVNHFSINIKYYHNNLLQTYSFKNVQIINIGNIECVLETAYTNYWHQQSSINE